MQLSISVGYAIGPAIGGGLQEVRIYISQSSTLFCVNSVCNLLDTKDNVI